MRADQYRHERRLGMTQAQTKIWDVVLPLGLTDLELLQVLAEMQTSLTSRLVNREMNDAT